LIITDVSYSDPVRVFESFRERPYSFFLDSGMDSERLGRYSLMGSDPFLVFRCKGGDVEVFEGGSWREQKGDPFRILQELMKRFHIAGDSRVPVAAGAFGYFAYDLGWQIEKLPQMAVDDLGLPDCYLGFYDRLVIGDNRRNKMFLTSTGLPEQGERASVRARQRLEELENILYSGKGGSGVDAGGISAREKDDRAILQANLLSDEPDKGIVCEQLKDNLPPSHDNQPDTSGKDTIGKDTFGKGISGEDASGKCVVREQPRIFGHFTYDSYCAAVQRVKDYISAGDILQANLTQRFSCRLQEKPWQLYLRLREINPAPFAAYLHYPELDIASASPERFIKINDGYVETRPIKGTRPRGRDSLDDMRLRTELLQSEKDHTELAMITNLVHRELERVCSHGSVEVPELFCLEEYPTVFHLVSTVRGELAPDKDVIDLLLATFPGGSITGTPKMRSMEVIEELEPVKRGIYTGSIGYLGFDGNVDLSIVIRTFIIKDGTAYFQVGGGITDGSEPDAEYWETLDKARALLDALGCDGEVKVCQVSPG
jgi:para-aminobenzoate synthetase component 1